MPGQPRGPRGSSSPRPVARPAARHHGGRYARRGLARPRAARDDQVALVDRLNAGDVRLAGVDRCERQVRRERDEQRKQKSGDGRAQARTGTGARCPSNRDRSGMVDSVCSFSHHHPEATAVTTRFRTPRGCRKYQKLLALLTNDHSPASFGVPSAARHRAASSSRAPRGIGRGFSGHAAPELPHLLVRPDRQPGRRLDAVGRAALARPRARRLAAPARPGAGAHVRAVHDPGADRRRARGSCRQAAHRS